MYSDCVFGPNQEGGLFRFLGRCGILPDAMGEIAKPQPVLLMIAAFSRHAEALDWGRDWATQVFGDLLLESPRFEFRETDYYTPSMGPELLKTFWAFERLIDPGELAGIKRQTNAWEAEYAAAAGQDEARPLNLDPGYIGLGKLVLASTKDHAHRIYLGQGIYAEVTLYYKDGQWQAREWTFADYRRADYQQFFETCRDVLKKRLRNGERPV